MYFVIATQTGWQPDQLDNMPLSEVKSYYDESIEFLKLKNGVK